MTARRTALALTVVALPIAFCGFPVQAQSIMRSPTINIGSRVPTISSNVAARVGGNITARGATNVGGAGDHGSHISGIATRVNPRLAVVPTLPFVRYSPNLYPACGSAYRDGDGECLDQPVISAAGGSGGGSSARKGAGARRSNAQQAAAVGSRTIARELVAEIDGALSDAQADELARRHGLVRVASQTFPLLGASIGLFRITDGRATEAVRSELAGDGSVRSVQPNFRYLMQDQKSEPAEGDPAQYALVKLRLPQAHALAHGMNVTIAVIDSGIDAGHPELANSIADSFDALGSKEGPHVHGTGIAGAIAAHARLMGGAPAARILAIRAFGTDSSSSQSNSYVILKALDYASLHGAQIINMSFAGPKDPIVDRGIAAAAGKGIVLVAAAGNAGAKSPPLYPAANAHVIAVSATDAQDRLLAASNRGSHIAVAAPGADIFLPAPGGKYQMTSGTSFSAAYVSAVAALVLERNPALNPEQVRATLMNTARDLGSPGRDDLFGAGEADAYAAVQAAVTPGTPVAAASEKGPAEKSSEGREIPSTRALSVPAATMASEKSTAAEADRPGAR